MCRIEYADDDGMWLHDPAEQGSRKDHRCDDCGRPILKGERYTYGVWLHEGTDVLTVKVCQQCVAAGYWLNKVCGGHLWPGVIEELEEHWDEEPDLRSNGLGWLITAAKQHWTRRGELIPVEVVDRWARKAVAKVPAAALHGAAS